ncbi:selenide, water dikinase SelD, partial [Streptomyces sp. SID625]|nr:selenide, water dikinase SelD [Streptomyces sp. SID625]
MTTTGETPVRLTQFAHGGGCACKIPPGELEEVLGSLTAAPPVPSRAALLVGAATGDDAAVVRLPAAADGGTQGMAMVCTA